MNRAGNWKNQILKNCLTNNGDELVELSVNTEDEFLDDTITLYSLSNCLSSLLDGGINKGDRTIEDIIDLYVSVRDAIELLSEFDRADNEDVKHEFGYQYSEIIADIDQMVIDMNQESGVNLFLH